MQTGAGNKVIRYPDRTIRQNLVVFLQQDTQFFRMFPGQGPGRTLIFFQQGNCSSDCLAAQCASCHHPGRSQCDMGNADVSAGHQQIGNIPGIQRPEWNCV